MEPTVKLTGFDLIELLGKGGIGAVWKARQLSLDRIVAIKLLLPEFNRDKDENRRLVLEARTAAKLKHAGIVQVYDANEENGIFFFVMEYVAGYSVGTWLRRKHKLTEADTITVGLSVADALDYAWRATKLIHCDIKPDNIMVDTDGAIKVADLGLSRTFDTREDAQYDDVLGTPSYMSPEQVKGESDLDCRTDIYALGATMYHMVTGHRPFQEAPDREAADLQISGYLSDAIELNPALTPAFRDVLEKMLAKNRDDRYTRWDEIGRDLRLVMAHKALQTPQLAPGASTMQRKRKSCLNPGYIARQAGKWTLIVGLIAIVLLAIGRLAKPVKSFARAVLNSAPMTMAPTVVPAPPTPVADQIATPAMAVQTPVVSADLAAYGAWQTWFKSNANDYDGSMARLTEIVRRNPGSEGAAKAGAMLVTMRKQREDAMRLVWERLEAEADGLGKKQQHLEAARLIESYSGPFAAGLQARRTALAGTYRARADERLDAAQNTRDEQALLNRLGALMSTGACVAAQAEIAARLADGLAPSAGLRDKMMRITAVINADGNVEARVLSTFASQTGRLVTVEMGRGRQNLQIVAVADCRVRARTTDMDAEVEFGVAELSTAEREGRLSLLNDDAACLRRGIAAFGANNLDAARMNFEKIGPPLGPLLTGQVDAKNKDRVEVQAQTAWNAIMQEFGLNPGAGDDNAVTPDMAGRLLLSVVAAKKTTKKLQAFREQFGSSLVAQRTAPVFNVLERECERMLQNVNDRGEASGTGQIMGGAELRRALLDANPALEDHAVNIVEQDGRVVELHVCADSLRNLTPLAQAGSLREVSVKPLKRDTLVVDVKALTRLPELSTLSLKHIPVPDPTVFSDLKLKDLTVERAGLRDLQWVKKMALRRLSVNGNLIKDFSPLRSQEELESLWVSDTGLINLDGVPLRRLLELGVSRTSVRDLSVLREAPLNRLEVAGVKIMEWSWLRGLALKSLNISDSSFRDLTLLTRMPLQVLIMRNTSVSDFSVLKDLPLVQLDVSGTGFQDVTQLRGLRLEYLSLARTRVTSVSLGMLADMPLHRLDLSETAVTDLKLLKNLPLEELNLTGTKVRDLTPIRDLPLTSLFIEGTRIKDLTPLDGMPIKYLRLTVDEKERSLRDLLPVLRGLPSLKEVNGMRVDDLLRGPRD